MSCTYTLKMVKNSLQRQLQNINCIQEESYFIQRQNISSEINLHDTFFSEKLIQKKEVLEEKIQELNIILKENCHHELEEDEIEIPTNPDYPIIKKIIYCKHCELIF